MVLGFRRCLLLFSAYAEVFLIFSAAWKAAGPFLCLRRGVSSPKAPGFMGTPLFSAYAEVFPGAHRHRAHKAAFLCLRRGVSEKPQRGKSVIDFSLPTQRCFLTKEAVALYPLLFSAYAEVFPGAGLATASRSAFLCLRRGVSY